MESKTPKSKGAGKVGGVILSHGQLSNELLAAAETVVGELSFVTAAAIGWHDDAETARNELVRAIERVSQGSGVLLLTDMFGGVPTNIAATFLADGKIEILTGVNLPMVIRLAEQDDDSDLREVARQVCAAGRKGIYQAGDLLVPLKLK